MGLPRFRSTEVSAGWSVTKFVVVFSNPTFTPRIPTRASRPPDARLSGTEIEGHTKKGDFDDEIDTDTSIASDETTSVFWSSGGGTTTTAADNSSSGGGTPEAGGAVVGGAQRSTSTASIPSTSARHADLPQLSPPPYETALLRSSGEKPSSAVNGKSFMSLPSALPRTSRSTTVGAKYLKGVAAAAAAALAKKARTRGFSSQHGGKASGTAGASNKTPIDDETSTAVAGANAGGEERRDPDEAATRGRQRGDGGGAQEMGEKLWSGGVRGVRGGLWEQLPPRLTRSPHPAPHHRYTQSAPEARVAGGDIARVSEVGPRARRVVRSLSLCTPTSTSAFWPDLLDVGAPSPAHREKETHPSQRPKGEAEAGGSGRDDEPGIPAPPSPVKVAFSVDPSNPSQRERRRKQGGRDRRCEGESGGAGCIFSPVAINPPGNVWSLARGLSAATPLGPAPSRAEPSWRESDHLEREQAVASAAAGGAAGARGGADGAAVGAVEPSPVGEWLMEDGGFSSPSPSSVWVTRYLDFSTTHGLVFVLSDGSVGILFKDNSNMVIDPTADTFDFTEAPCSPTRVTFPPSPLSSPLPPGEPRVGTERQARGSSGDSPEYPNLSNSAMPTHQYALDYFPFYLRKKCQVLRHFREHVLPDDDRTREGESESAAAAVAEDREEALAFIEKWQKEGDITCIQLSNKTMQVGHTDPHTHTRRHRERERETHIKREREGKPWWFIFSCTIVPSRGGHKAPRPCARAGLLCAKVQ